MGFEIISDDISVRNHLESALFFTGKYLAALFMIDLYDYTVYVS